VSLTVLVVDDHPGFRHQARLMLEEAGYSVVGEAIDAASAIGSVRRLQPQVVLLDVQLPDGDGFSVATALGTDPHPPTVVLISGRDRSDYEERIARCGARAFIAKADLTVETLRLALAGDDPDVG
jgi:DNA-binding NarL/FixJ family response regulator